MGDKRLQGSEIKALLHKDFGLDLNISGGSGQSISDPIEINADKADRAAHTELLVLRGLGQGRKILWRSISAQVLDGENSKRIIQRKLETKEVTSAQIISQIENYYFERVNAPISSDPLSPGLTVFYDEKAKLSFPYELGWLHFDGHHDYEQDAPGLGYSLAYNAPGIKSTVYVYPIPDRADRQNINATELERAKSETVRVYGEDFYDHEWDAIHESDHSAYFYIPKGESDSLSLIFVATKGDYFVKVRSSMEDDPLMRDISSDFIKMVRSLIKHSTIGEEAVVASIFDEAMKAYKNENLQWAMTLFENLASLGDPVSQFNLANFYYKGEGAERDPAAAFHWMKKAANNGVDPAIFYLGTFYRFGIGTDQDFNEAVKWTEKAAENGVVEAEFDLAEHYRRGLGVRKDLLKAMELLLRSAQKGFAKSQLNLAEFYRHGDATDIDNVSAYAWALKAANDGLDQASITLDELRQIMTAAQISEAEEMSDNILINNSQR